MARTIHRLSPRFTTTAKFPRGKQPSPRGLLRERYADGGNLFLVVQAQCTRGPKGRWVYDDANITRSWEFKYELYGQRHFLGLGATHTVNLREARDRARLYRQQLLDGVDPLEQRRERVRAAIAEKAKAITFKECAMSYFALHGGGWARKHRQQWENSLRDYVLPTLGRLAPADIDQALVMKTVEPIWTKIPVTSGRVLDRIAVVLDYAAASGYRSGDNPARSIRAALPKQSKISKITHHPALPFDEVPAFITRLRAVGTTEARALEMLILTSARTDEIRCAQWSEIDFAKRLWNRPAEHMKSAEGHTIPLPARVIQILRSLPPGKPDELVFARADGSQIGHRIMGRLTKRLAPKGIDAVPHGFRSSFRQWAAERTNYPDHICEAALAHKISDAVIKAYKRKAEPFERRVALMEAWARFCTAPLKPAAQAGNVVAIGAGAMREAADA
jgi:integrase